MPKAMERTQDLPTGGSEFGQMDGGDCQRNIEQHLVIMTSYKAWGLAAKDFTKTNFIRHP